MVYVPLFDLDGSPPICAEFKVIDPDQLQIEPTGNVFNIEHCNKIFGLLPEDQVRLNDWVRDMQKWARKKCR